MPHLSRKKTVFRMEAGIRELQDLRKSYPPRTKTFRKIKIELNSWVMSYSFLKEIV